ncbi:MAG: AAA family ATPase [Dehalococcoidia bacterium]|nr:AAA family ATPase [Dehalococcoidia bacterium]
MELSTLLNPSQIEAVQAVDGPVLVVAGPGSGKTRVIVYRIAYLVRTCGVRPSRIMAVTFTNKAAREMRDRIDQVLGGAQQNLTMGTFHAIGARLLRTYADSAGLDPNFVIYDADDQTQVVKRSLEDAGVDHKKFSPNAVKHAISAAKSQMVTPAEFAGRKSNYFDEIVHRVYDRYEAVLEQSHALDFDDLIVRVVRLLEGNAEVRERVQDRYVHVLVDEFQDTNAAQYRMARLIAEKHRNLCVVGDPDQAIYSWRQADVANILNFEKDFPGARVIHLEQNYRSTGTIIKAADKVIAVNRNRPQRKLWTENSDGLPIIVHDALNEQDEALFIVNEVDRLVKREGFKHGDCAVLYRTNAQSRAVEEAFVRYGLPYHLVGATRFYERREVKDVLAYLRVTYNPYDDVNLLRIVNVPSRGIGQKSLDELARWANRRSLPLYAAIQLLGEPPEQRGEGPDLGQRAEKALAGFLELIRGLEAEAKGSNAADLIKRVLAETGYRDYLLASDDDGEDRLENVMELRTVAEEFSHLRGMDSLAALLEQVALVADSDNVGEKPNSTTLITLHQAKGLEYPVVFIAGMEEGLLPHARSMEDAAQMEEERRLCYVGMTRAQQRLYLVRAYRRAAMGMRSANEPSRFLRDVPPELTALPQRKRVQAAGFQPEMRMAAMSGAAARDREAASVAPAGPPAYKAGERVKHGTFGEGVVITCHPSGSDQEVTVAFRGTAGVKKLLLSFAPLERVQA